MNNMEKIISNPKLKENGSRRIRNKRGWFDYLNKDGNMVFTPQDLKDTIIQVLDKNPPKGDRLFHLSKKFNFTMLPKGPYRIEEALERFIVISNNDNFYNQIPIGGGKESIDIGIKENNSKFIFVELKPWRSDNSPIYAFIESLKNLIEYRMIIKRKIKDIEKFKEIELAVLAPVAYYQTYRLINQDGTNWGNNISVLKKTLIEIGKKFQTVISFMILDIDIDFFLGKCQKIYKDQKKRVVTVSKSHRITALARDRWRLLVSS